MTLRQEIEALAARTHDAGVTLDELAKRTGIDRSTFYRLMAGRNVRPHRSTLKLWDAALQAPTQEEVDAR
jgi:transcriptional regulator with XRE-family HTH domain